jgi:lipopolysaccharide heptosyltransferase II
MALEDAARAPTDEAPDLPRQAKALVPRPGRILVKEVNWLGDLVMSLPTLRAIRAAYLDARLSVLVKKELAGFFDGVEWVDEVIPYTLSRGIRGLADRRRIVRAIHKRGFDLAVLFPSSFDSALWVTLAGVRRRAGYAADSRGPMLTHKTVPQPHPEREHQVNHWLRMVRETIGVAISLEEGEYPLRAYGPHVAKMTGWLAERRCYPEAKLIAIAPAAAYGPAKEWALVRYAALVDLLAQRFGAECVFVGGSADRRKCEQVAATSVNGAIVAAGETGVGELIALLSRCDGFAGNDSGPMHVAGALGIPTVGIFGSTNATRTGPLGPRATAVYHRIECSPCLARTCRFGHYECLRLVTPEEVADALERLGAFH